MNKIELTAELLAANPNIAPKQIAKKLGVKVSYAYLLRKKARDKQQERDETNELIDMLGRIAEPAPELKPTSPLDVQVGGEHYKTMAIQPVEFITANNLGFLEGCIIKRISRWRSKDGLKDLNKIKHEVDLLIALNNLSDK